MELSSSDKWTMIYVSMCVNDESGRNVLRDRSCEGEDDDDEACQPSTRESSRGY